MSPRRGLFHVKHRLRFAETMEPGINPAYMGTGFQRPVMPEFPNV